MVLFFGGKFSQMGLYPEQVYKMVCFFSRQNEKTPDFLGTLLNGLQMFTKYFWIWPQIGVGFTKLC
jgi:hypothetical protein